jgi:TnpA family transposase
MSRLNSKFSDELIIIVNSKHNRYRLYYALLAKYYEVNHRFFKEPPHFSGSLLITLSALFAVSSRINIPSEKIQSSYRSEIRAYFKVSVNRAEHELLIRKHIFEIISFDRPIELAEIKKSICAYLRKIKIETPSDLSLERIIKSVASQQESDLFEQITDNLSHQSKVYLDSLLRLREDSTSQLFFIKRCADGISLKSILTESEKLKFLRQLKLPVLLDKLPENTLKRYYRNICTKYPSAIKAMPETHRYAFLSIFCFIRQRELNDTLTDLLIQLIKRIFVSGENKLKFELSKVFEIKKGCNNKKILNLLASAIISHEDILVKDAIYPVISKKELEDILVSNNGKASSYADCVYKRARSSYLRHYRRMLSPVMEVLDFKSNNTTYQPIIEALKLIKDNLYSKSTLYPEESTVPIDGVIKKSHQKHLIELTKQGDRINRIDYELGVLHKLRSKIRVKEIWIDKAYRYRNPEEDLPQDFEENKDKYYKLLKTSVSAKDFVSKLKKDLANNLANFNKSLPSNPFVKILKKPKGHIKVAKLKEQKAPPQLETIKQEVFQRWQNTSLLDVLKETDLFVNFTDDFVASGPKEALPKDILKKRLLLSILGYGTNTGLKSMSMGNSDVSYQDLKHIKLRYFDPDNLRHAIRKVINQLLKIRITDIWEGNTTTVASDAKHFKTSDQNLMSQWHPRYHKTGVMIYWHVDKNSTCIYSQLKNCASSEVSAMIEGILRHCTDTEVSKSYVDTHGQSEVGFAFAYMLGFRLMPRFKNIHLQKLYPVMADDSSKYSHLQDILSNPIKWDLIENEYEQFVQYSVALKLGSADSESIMRRFTRNNLQHPTYRGLCELGKAIKTIFICQYLSSHPMRREVHESLNIIERWNSVNEIIFYGKKGAMRTKNPAELELSMLCLHLLQLSMVYINTLMLQQVLQDSNWLPKMTIEDKRAISPLISEHLNPYGEFPFDLKKRLALRHPSLPKAA